MRNAERGGGVIGGMRHGAERGEIAVDKAGIDLAARGTRRRGKIAPRKATLLRTPAISVRSSALRQPVERGLRASAHAR